MEKGCFVRHPSEETHAKWGVGIVLEGEVGGVITVYFEKPLKQMKIKTDVVKLVRVEDPGEAGLFLKNAIYENNKDRMPFPLVLDRFLARFEGGLRGDVYKVEEREYKLKGCDFVSKQLSKSRMDALISKSDWGTIATDIKRAFSQVNLLASFELMKLNDAFKRVDDVEYLCRSFYELMYGELTVFKRVDIAAKSLSRFDLDKWPVITYLLFMAFPEKYMFVKPTMMREAAGNRGFDIQYSSQVNGSAYQRVMMFSEELLQRLQADTREELHPIDMIDVQGFMWCTFADGWTDESIRKAEEKLRA